MKTRRPRVAAIGLDPCQVASIESLCGELRSAVSVARYLQDYSWTETDVVVSCALLGDAIDGGVSLMTIGEISFRWPHRRVLPSRGWSFYELRTDVENKERELAVTSACPDLYKPLAAELARQLDRAAEPPSVMRPGGQVHTALIETTSGHPVALRVDLYTEPTGDDRKLSTPIALLLPEAADFPAWFRAFLCDVHRSDPIRVPQAPPRLSQPLDWYTPQERVLADRISQIELEIQRLSNERHQLQTELVAEAGRADREIRRALWDDGDELVAAVRDILTDLGFAVRDMDAQLGQAGSKREDLRITLQGRPRWQGVVEVKGYTSGIRTNDARQIREHRDRYSLEEGRPPDLTLWLSNPYRTRDPSSRPAPDGNVKVAAEVAGAVHVLASDFYRQWALMAAGCLDADTVIQSLVNADPGLWIPPASGT